MIKRTSIVYGFLLAVWGVIVAWQALEHNRVKDSARSAVINRARATAKPLRGVIQSLGWGRSGRLVEQERLQTALKGLVAEGDILSIALLNAAGEEVVSAGTPIDLEMIRKMQTGEHWDSKSVTVVSRVELGDSETPEGEGNSSPFVVPSPPRRDFSGPRDRSRTNEVANSSADRPTRGSTNAPASASPATTRTDGADVPSQGDRGPRRRPPPFSFGMSEEERKSLAEKKGLHGLVVAVSNESFEAASTRDLWLRWIIGSFAGVSVIGFGFAWRNLDKSSELQMRLLRASEMNSHLKGMNVAAAGLAHETRNPLNIIRGLSQMISKETDSSAEIRKKSREIADEVDRVTAQLNEFINYSKPREVRRAPVALNLIVGDVVRALTSDIEDKAIHLAVSVEGFTVEADEQMLRQVLFNLLLNAIQAVDPKGEILVTAAKFNSVGAYLEVRDNGPGVPPDQRADIFKPYFTTHQKGTGLGLAVVQQIVLAHGWDIDYISNEPSGAVFRLSRLKLSSRT